MRWSLTPGVTALAIRVSESAGLGAALAALGIEGPRPVLVLVGGAAGLDPDLHEPLLDLFRTLVPVLTAAGALVVDGGTRSGVMALMGEAALGTELPLLGVAARGTLCLPSQNDENRTGADEGADPDPGHGRFLLVPGTMWGDESPWIAAVASILAGDRPSLTLVVGGGEVTARDLREGLNLGRPALILAGTGGTADALAAGLRGGRAPTGNLSEGTDNLVEVMDLGQAALDLPPLLRQRLGWRDQALSCEG
ncbi:MAG TPA: hypothetical protein VLM84_06505 [Chromatiaceae bacterium]|nr:hypothetical protein [Chromatiaceae bacterium]